MSRQPVIMATDRAVVFVIDDDASVREALEDLLASVGLEVRTFASTQDFAQAKRDDVASCIVLDVRLPGASGLEFQRQLSESGVDLPVIFISGYGDVPMTVRAMKSGAVEFLTKPIREQELLDAVNIAIGRDRLARRNASTLAELRTRYSALTPRERAVFALVVTGLPNKLIGAQLDLSEMTVKVHRSQITRKMRARSVVELVRIADRLGVSNLSS